MRKMTRYLSSIFLTIAGVSISGAGLPAAKYGVPVALYGVPVAPVEAPATETKVSIHGTITQADGKTAISGLTVRAVDDAVKATTNAKGEYTMTIGMREGETTQVLAVDPDGKANGGDFSSDVADVTLNTTNTDKTDDADQTVNFTLQPKPERK